MCDNYVLNNDSKSIRPTVSWSCFALCRASAFLIPNSVFVRSPLNYLHGRSCTRCARARVCVYVCLRTRANLPHCKTDSFAAGAYPWNVTPKVTTEKVHQQETSIMPRPYANQAHWQTPVFRKKRKRTKKSPLKRLEGGPVRPSPSRPLSRWAPQRHHNWKLSIFCSIIKWRPLNSVRPQTHIKRLGGSDLLTHTHTQARTVTHAQEKVTDDDSFLIIMLPKSLTRNLRDHLLISTAHKFREYLIHFELIMRLHHKVGSNAEEEGCTAPRGLIRGGLICEPWVLGEEESKKVTVFTVKIHVYFKQYFCLHEEKTVLTPPQIFSHAFI